MPTFRLTPARTSTAYRAGVSGQRVREMQQDCTADEFKAEVAAAKRTLITVPVAERATPLMLPADTASAFVGLDADGDIVVKAWHDYTVPLTPCCYGSASCDDEGTTYCKGCYRTVSYKYGMDSKAVLLRTDTATVTALS